MPAVDAQPAVTLQKRLLIALFLAGLFLLSFKVLHIFLIPVAWAGILVYVTWPFYVRLRRVLKNRHTPSALLMTLALTLALIVPVAWVVLLLQAELSSLYQKVALRLAQGPVVLPPFLHDIPWLGTELQNFVTQMSQDPEALRKQLKVWADHGTGYIGQFLGGVGRNLGKMGFALLTAFFLYRDGERLIAQLRAVLQQILGERVDGYLQAIGATTRAVVYGIGLTALAQGLLAGLGYWVAGAPSPVFLGVLTTMIALVPFGTPFAWGAVCIWLVIDGQVWAAAGLFLWGMLVVSWVDNIIRPMVISSATQIPFLLVMFGVLGGVAGFGMVGLFIGPVILAVMVAVWREWLEDTAHAGG